MIKVHGTNIYFVNKRDKNIKIFSYQLNENQATANKIFECPINLSSTMLLKEMVQPTFTPLLMIEDTFYNLISSKDQYITVDD